MNKQEVNIYKTKAALGKARARVAKNLPSDPRRAKEVVDSLKRIIDKSVGYVEVERVEEENRKATKLGFEVRNKIADFYYQKDVSITFPGKEDYVMVRGKDGVKTKMVKHVLVLTLREAYSEFTKDNGDIELSLYTFSKQRPLNVLSSVTVCQKMFVCAIIMQM